MKDMLVFFFYCIISYFFHKYLLNAYYVSDTLLGTGNIKNNKAIDHPPFMELIFLLGRSILTRNIV